MSRRESMSRFISLSSINRIFGMISRCFLWPFGDALSLLDGLLCQAPADSGGQLDQIRWVLGDDPFGLSPQDAKILRGQLLRGDHDDRDASEDRSRAQLLQKLEAVHLRHHQVEQD